jgi:hypothetical protein
MPLPFEHTVRWTEKTWAALQAPERPTRRGLAANVAVAAVGVALLFNGWTSPVGGLVLGFAAFVWFVPRMSRKGARTEFRLTPFLREPVTYGVSTDKVWVRAGSIRAECGWSGVAVWDEREDWLEFQAAGLPRIYLPISGLRDAGVYDDVLAHVSKHAVRFGSPEAKALPL